jgi:hypothetical protein
LKYLLVIIFSILLCSCQNTSEREWYRRDLKVEVKLTSEIDRICNVLGFKRKGDIKFKGYFFKDGLFKEHKPYTGRLYILINNEIMDYQFVFFMIDGKALLRNFIQYGRGSSETSYDTKVNENIKQNIIKVVSIVADQVKIKYHGEPDISETNSYYYIKYNSYEPVPVNTDAMVTFKLTKDIEVVGVYHGA